MSTSAKTKTDVFLESRLPRLDTTQNARERPTSGRKDDRKSSSLKDLQKKYSTFNGLLRLLGLQSQSSEMAPFSRELYVFLEIDIKSKCFKSIICFFKAYFFSW